MSGPSAKEVHTYFETLSNWGRWGKEDESGTLNLITPQKRIQASSLVLEGTVISCSREISEQWSVDNPDPLLHFMTRSGDAAPEEGQGVAMDWFGMEFHGQSVTHLDALSHHMWDRSGYNGFPNSRVSTLVGAEVGAVDVAREGIVSRGVLLDVPRSEGIAFMNPGEGISPAMLERCEISEGVHVEQGDVLIVRTGRDLYQNAQPDRRSGLRADCLPWLHDRGISALGSDAIHDVGPSVYEGMPLPIHSVGIVAMGLWLIDNLAIEHLAEHCFRLKRWEFLFMISPLLLKYATGSPVNPLALL